MVMVMAMVLDMATAMDMATVRDMATVMDQAETNILINLLETSVNGEIASSAISHFYASF